MLVYIVGYLLLVAFSLALQHWSLSGLPKYWLFVAILLCFVFTYILAHPKSFIQRGSTRTFLVIATSIIILLRLIWILAIPTLPFSDFEFYNAFATQIVQQKSFEIESIAARMYSLGYPIVLAATYEIFGVHLMLAKLLNILFSVLMAMLLFWIVRYSFDECVARVTMVLFIFWPAQIMYNSVLASEHLYIVVLLFGIFVLIRNLLVKSATKCYDILGAGTLLGLSYTIRSVSMVVVAVGFVKLLFAKGTLARRVGKAISLFVGFTLVLGVYLGAMSLLGAPSASPSLVGHSLMIGTNYDSKGMWNPDDAQVWVHNSPEEAKRIAVQRAFNRITLSPIRFVVLVFEKFGVMWGDDLYGAYWSTAKMDTTRLTPLIEQNQMTLYAISQLFYIWILFLSAVGCYKLRKGQLNSGTSLLLMIFLAFVILHSFLEVQSRYHYPWDLIFLILAGYGIVGKQVESSL